MKYMYIAHSGREGAEGSAVGVRSASRDREAAAGGSVELAGRTSAVSARIRGGADSPLRAVSRRHAGPAARARGVSSQLHKAAFSNFPFRLFLRNYLISVSPIHVVSSHPVYYRNISCTAIPLYGDSSE